MALTARQEWRTHWPLVLAATLGVALGSIHVYSTGIFIEPLEREFGWSRAEISAGLSLVSVIGVFGAPLFGYLVNRLGSRRIALPGTVFLCASIAALSLATSSIWSWWGLWVLVALSTLFMKPTVWSTAVSSVFNKSRGLALAVVLSGTGLGSALTPIVANYLIEHFGWRGAYLGLGLGAAVLVVPTMWFLFFDARDRLRLSPAGTKATAPAMLTGWSMAEGFRARQFYQLWAAALITTLIVVGFVVHLVPLLGDAGISRATAVSLAGMVGIMSIIGRLTVGYLMDRLPGPPVGTISVSLPIVAALILLAFPGSVPAAVVAVAVLGLSVGGEYDAIIYLCSRFFGMRNFAALFGWIASGLLAGMGLGPVLAGWIHDRWGSYEMFLVAVIPMGLLAGLMIATLGKYPRHVERPG
ncbi:MAG: MFS transporter [Porticoccaceae bacterium]|jgi:MFS family permease|nr:MFS transporter [Porticoccaceae bacterium]HLS99518.1 MFS transporter [Porticoccaceae bacterium]